ncbi:class A beta-lactamase [Brevundimonas sp. 'scallop']|uniref:class A beta-lactamase n=1 Tax=Brevundimonas sp. 'scallop' TaxID=2562582 RepID=UPI0013E1F2C5|nr:class A beta-lactamase [Brevundimonas sp. 'scallop']QIF81152.1 class A beta-lactamase [Brevundimonas sp. 'scallop']
MRAPVERRCVLTGLAALSAVGCSPRAESHPAAPAPLSEEIIDLSDLEARNGGRLGFVVQDAATGRKLGWRGDERFVYCSTFKMYLAAATLLRAQAGQERLDRRIPITAADMINHAPVTEPAVGASLTVEQLMKGAVEVSDNPAANLLLKAMGGPSAMQTFYRGIGDGSTRSDRFEPEMNRLDGDKDTILPNQSVANLRRLFLDQASPLTAASRDLLLQWMTDTPTGQNRLRAGTPANWRVAHKTGTGGYGPTNDIGLLYPPNGQPVIVAAYYHAAQATSDDANAAVIAEATRRALKALGRD